MGSVTFFHVLLACGLFVPALLVLAVIVRAARGELPIEFSTTGLKYEKAAEDLKTFKIPNA